MDEIVCDICNSPIKRKKDLPRHKRSEFCQKVNELLNKFQNTNFTKINFVYKFFVINSKSCNCICAPRCDSYFSHNIKIMLYGIKHQET